MSIPTFAASDTELDAFREAMIGIGCHFASTDDSQSLQQSLGWDDVRFSDVMTNLTVSGELICTSGCELKNPACP